MTLGTKLAGIALACAMTLTPQPERVPSQPLIVEDDPRWDCATMGNRICGPDYETDTGEYIGGYN